MSGSMILKTSVAAVTAYAMSTMTVLAMSSPSSRPDAGGNAPGGGSVASVPEIDASTGILAIAAVLAVVAFVWERNRRRRA